METVHQNKRVKEYVKNQHERLVLLEGMWSDPLVRCYNDAYMPTEAELERGSVFLAGPTSVHQILEYNYRCLEWQALRGAGFQGIIYAPEPRGYAHKEDFTDGYILDWKQQRLFTADHPVIWVPREGTEMLGLDTNFMWGFLTGMIYAGIRRPKDIFIGWPDNAERMGLPDYFTRDIAGCKRYDSIRRLCYAVVGKKTPEDILSDARDLDDAIPF